MAIMIRTDPDNEQKNKIYDIKIMVHN